MSFGDHMDYLDDIRVSPPRGVSLRRISKYWLAAGTGIDWAREGCDHTVLAIAYAAQAGAPEIPVTAEMPSDGFNTAFQLQPRSPLLTETLTACYRAMRAAEPPREDDFLSALQAYREQFALAVERAREIANLKRIIASLQEMSQHQADAVGEASNLLVMKDARIAELDTELALLRRMKCDDPAPPPPTYPQAPPPDPIPAIIADKTKPPKDHNPFQTFPSDPRRMGP